MKARIKQEKGLQEQLINERLFLEICDCPFIVDLHFAFQNEKAFYFVSRAGPMLCASLTNSQRISPPEGNYSISSGKS